MAPAAHAFSVAAQEHVDDMLGAELLTCSSYAGQYFLCRERRVGQTLNLSETDVASIAFRFGVFLAEVFGQFAVPAMNAGAQPAHVSEEFAAGGDTLGFSAQFGSAPFNQR